MNSITAIMYHFCDTKQLKGDAQTLRTSVQASCLQSIPYPWQLILQEALDLVDWRAIAQAISEKDDASAWSDFIKMARSSETQ